MSATKTEKKVAYVFEDVGGWFVCADAGEMLDTRGAKYDTKNQAIASLKQKARDGQTEYTHYRTGGSAPRKL